MSTAIFLQGMGIMFLGLIVLCVIAGVWEWIKEKYNQYLLKKSKDLLAKEERRLRFKERH